jgi:adenylate cyclase
MDAPTLTDSFLFGRFRLDPLRGLLRRDGASDLVPVSLGSRALAVLRVLIERNGDLISKDEIMAAVWPNTSVEEANLSMHISTLRRILDDGSETGSCIKTASGRGYRFALPVARLQQAHASVTLALPRLSIVVLPFEHLSGDPQDGHLADAVTDDLTSELTLIPDLSITAREAANAFGRHPPDARTVGEALQVRYVLKGHVRRVGSTLRVNVQLVSTETGAILWSDRFDEDECGSQGKPDNIVTRIKDELEIKLIDIENARSLSERPNDPDAFDLVLRARSMQNRPPGLPRDHEVVALLERALALDPSSVYAMSWIAFFLSYAVSYAGWGDFSRLQRAECLLMRALAIAPESPMVLNAYVMWLRTVGRCAEAIEVCERAIRMHPRRIRGWMGFYHELGRCKTWMGYAEEGIALETEANRLNPRSPWEFSRYRHIGWYSLLLGRDLDAIDNLERSLAINAEGTPHFRYCWLAAAYARTGNVETARQYLVSAERLWPYDTVRSRAPELLTSPVYVEQFRRFQGALRLAGMRDHAEEDADFGIPVDEALRGELAGFTPTEAPGANTIRTADLVELLVRDRPVVIDAMTYTWGLSIPGAAGLKYAGLGGSFTDEAQDRLCSKMRELTSGNLDRPIVAVGWNSERFDGRNLALRLVALGHSQVNWYRGGREAWEVAGLPETDVDLQHW